MDPSKQWFAHQNWLWFPAHRLPPSCPFLPWPFSPWPDVSRLWSTDRWNLHELPGAPKVQTTPLKPKGCGERWDPKWFLCLEGFQHLGIPATSISYQIQQANCRVHKTLVRMVRVTQWQLGSIIDQFLIQILINLAATTTSHLLFAQKVFWTFACHCSFGMSKKVDFAPCLTAQEWQGLTAKQAGTMWQIMFDIIQ